MKNRELEELALNQEELHSALFSNLVLQEGNMALMLLGKVPHPETGETVKDLDSAKLFIDQLEMLAAKTKGNLNPDEQSLLNQTLTAVRMAYVEEAKPSSAPRAGLNEAKTAAPASAIASTRASSEEEESKKKFVKRY
jgi:hypothetical protein